MKRRAFIRGIFGAAVLSPGLSLMVEKALAAVTKTEKDFLNTSESETIRAYLDTIIPKTLKGPSATEAGVMAFLVKLFNNELPKWHRLRFVSNNNQYQIHTIYKELGRRLNDQSIKQFSKQFAKISDSERLIVVTKLADATKLQVGYQVAGPNVSGPLSDADIFKLTRSHAFQGYLAEPKYGGNKDYLAWESLNHICHMTYEKENDACITPGH